MTNGGEVVKAAGSLLLWALGAAIDKGGVSSSADQQGRNYAAEQVRVTIGNDPATGFTVQWNVLLSDTSSGAGVGRQEAGAPNASKTLVGSPVLRYWKVEESGADQSTWGSWLSGFGSGGEQPPAVVLKGTAYSFHHERTDAPESCNEVWDLDICVARRDETHLVHVTGLEPASTIFLAVRVLWVL